MVLSAAIVFAFGVGAGMVRVLPWLLSPDVPWSTAIPFAEELWQRASEVALAVGLPVGAATAAALFVESGGARSLMALGASPGRLALAVAHVGLLFVVAAVALGSAQLGGDPPGRFAARLIRTGRVACEGAPNTSRADVPFVGAAWLCFRGAPRLAGRVPGMREDLVFSALRVEDNEAPGFNIDDLHIAGRLGEPARTAFRFHAATARVKGIGGFGADRSRWAGAMRGGLISGTATLASLALAWLVLRQSLSRPLHAACGAAAVAIALLLCLRELDERPFRAALPVASRSVR